MQVNCVYFKSSHDMVEVPSDCVDLIVTSPPYFNIKDYSLNGYQTEVHSKKEADDYGSLSSFSDYINSLLSVWKECERVLKPNGKICINVPLVPILKRDLNTHHNRHIFDLQSSIQHSILQNTGLFLMDIYIWNRTNPQKRLMFGSYPNPRNFYAQNIIEFITVYVKDGKPDNNVSPEIKKQSALSQDEWVDYTKQIWNIPIPGKGDPAFGEHPAIMPEELAKRCIKLFSFVDDLILDPFAGSGTTLKVAKDLKRNYIGYEIYQNYEAIINKKLSLNDK